MALWCGQGGQQCARVSDWLAAQDAHCQPTPVQLASCIALHSLCGLTSHRCLLPALSDAACKYGTLHCSQSDAFALFP